MCHISESYLFLQTESPLRVQLKKENKLHFLAQSKVSRAQVFPCIPDDVSTPCESWFHGQKSLMKIKADWGFKIQPSLPLFFQTDNTASSLAVFNQQRGHGK